MSDWARGGEGEVESEVQKGKGTGSDEIPSVEIPSVEQPDGWREVDPMLRTLTVAAVGAALLSWWPAFTLGAYETVFFEQLLALWAASTAAFLVLVIFRRRRAVSWPHRLALLLPSVWLFVAFALLTGTGASHSALLFWLTLALTFAGGPYLAWILLRITLVGYDTLTHRQRWSVIGVVASVSVIAFTLGRLNPHFLTCDDFTISGNFPPPGCTAGPATNPRG